MPPGFSPALTLTSLPASQVPDTDSSGVQPQVRRLANGTILVEFNSTPGRWHRVRFSNDLVNWYDCPPVPAANAGTRTQWVDGGPPFTNISPADPSVRCRYYTVREIIAP